MCGVDERLVRAPGSGPDRQIVLYGIGESAGCLSREELRSASAEVSAYRARWLKGGSHLCAPNYCLLSLPLGGARQPQMIDTGMCHMELSPPWYGVRTRPTS